MSMRTIVEFNHDYAHRIIDNPEGFQTMLQQLLHSGSYNEYVERQLKWFGVTVTPTSHHTTKRVLKIDENYEKEF